MNTEKLYSELEICIQAIQNGAEPQACLQLFPVHAAELEPLIYAAYHANQSMDGELSVEAFQRSSRKFMAEADNRQSKKSSALLRRQLPKIALASIIVAIILLFGVGSILSSSVQALPGDQIPSLKNAVENLRLRFSGDESVRTEIHASIKREIDEVQLLIDQGSKVDVAFSGEIDEISTEILVIEDVLIKMTPETTTFGKIDNGSFVLVKGTTNPNGWIDASEIYLEAKEIFGRIQNIDTTSITVNGVKILLKPEYTTDPRASEGDQIVLLLGTDESGNLYARAIIRVPDNFPIE